MGRGLGTKQQEMLDWLQQQWAAGSQPTRDELMGAFVVDKFLLYDWDRAMQRKFEDQLTRDGVSTAHAWVKAADLTRQHPDRPQLTDRPTAEGYRRALRTLVDRELVKVVADPSNRYRYCDPEADNPLVVTVNHGQYNEAVAVGTECGRRREPAVSAAQQRRDALLQCLPTDGAWVMLRDLTDAFFLATGAEQSLIDGAHEVMDKQPWREYPLYQAVGYRWLRTALLQLQKAGLVEVGSTAWGGTAIEPKTYPQQKVEAARLCVA